MAVCLCAHTTVVFLSSFFPPFSSVQRLPRYVLLLKELLRHTPATDTTHHSTIQQALTKIETVALFVNERKRSVENMNKLLQISEKISGGMPDDLELIEPHRKIMREGPVCVVSTRSILGVGVGTVKISKVNFLLFNDLLLWTNEANKYKGSLDLNQTTVSCVGDKDDKEKCVNAGSGTDSAAAVACGENMFQLSDAKSTIMCKCSSQSPRMRAHRACANEQLLHHCKCAVTIDAPTIDNVHLRLRRLCFFVLCVVSGLEEMKSWSDQIQQTITSVHRRWHRHGARASARGAGNAALHCHVHGFRFGSARLTRSFSCLVSLTVCSTLHQEKEVVSWNEKSITTARMRARMCTLSSRMHSPTIALFSLCM